MDVTDEVKLITKGFKRYYNEVRQGFWTPEMAQWTDESGFEEGTILNNVFDSEGNLQDIKPSPIICVTQDKIGHNDLTVSFTGFKGSLDKTVWETLSGERVHGYESYQQYGETIYRKKYTISEHLYNWDDGKWDNDWCSGFIFISQSGYDAVYLDNYQGENLVTLESIPEDESSKFSENAIMNQWIADVTGDTGCVLPIGSPSYGTIEFDFYMDSMNHDWRWSLVDQDETGFGFGCHTGTFYKIYMGNDGEPVSSIFNTESGYSTESGFWHSKIDFRGFSDVSWLGLDKNTFKITLTNEKSDDIIVDSGVITEEEPKEFFFTQFINYDDYINKLYIDNLKYFFDVDVGVEQFTIPKHTNPGEVFLLNSNYFKIYDINVEPRYESQPLTDLKFYGLTDNGSKILHSINWNKTFSDIKTAMFGMFGHPNKCPRCDGEGEVSGYQCIQCDGYGWDGPNASGEMLDVLGSEVNLVRTDDLEVFRNKIWAKNWLIVPTRNEIKRYFAHFGRMDESEVELTLDTGVSGMYSTLDIYLPLGALDLAIFGTGAFWNKMADRCANAGTRVGFSLRARDFTGELTFEETTSPYHDFYSGGTYYSGGYSSGVDFTGVDMQYGFYEPFSVQRQLDSFERRYSNLWGGEWKFANFTGQDSGDGIRTGYQLSGATVISGYIGSGEWWRWAQLEDGLSSADNGTDWHTGDSSFVDQQALWDSGTYYWDNFWASGSTDGVQY